MNTIKIYLISDSVGETARSVAAAVVAQFPETLHVDVQRFPFVADSENLEILLIDAKKENAIVVTTLVNPELVQQAQQFSTENNIQVIDVMSPLTRIIAKQTGVVPLGMPGTLRRLDEHYFHRIGAMEFAVRYDDGKEPKGFTEADLVILGVSRTSKTPLSMYLANKNYKVANLPLIPNVPLPPEIFNVPEQKIIGLTTSAEALIKIRQARLHSLGLNEHTSYTALTAINQELVYAQQIFEQFNATVVNVENRSIEETASLIEELIQKS